MPEPGRTGVKSMKDLYLAQSWDELMRVAENGNLMKSQESRAVISSIEKCVREADKSLADGDEERAFVLYHRAGQIAFKYYTNPAIDRKFFDAMVGKSVNRSVVACEQLSKSLHRRYDVLQDLDRRKYDTGSLNSQPSLSALQANGSDGRTQPELKRSDEAISCKELFQYVKSQQALSQPSSHCLVLDVRPAHEFLRCSISNTPFSRPNVIVANIPEDAVHCSSNMAELEKRLQPAVVQLLQCRRTAQKIVLVDHSSSEREKDSPLDKLYHILWTFARIGEQSDEPPVILQGGIKDWIITYPMYVTDPTFDLDKEKKSSTAPEAWAVDYSNEDEKQEVPSTQPDDKMILVNGQLDAPPVEVDHKEVSLKTWTKSHPGSAQPIPARTRPLVPDRSVKPNIPISTTNCLPDATKNGTGDSIHQDMKRRSEKSDEVADQLANAVKCIRLDTNQVDETPSPPTSRIKPVIDDKPAAYQPPAVNNAVSTKLTNGKPTERETGRVRTTDRTVSESKESSGWKAGAGPGSLSRSYSSPNIAKIVEQNETVHTDIPVFDREKKPKAEICRKKFREFNGIWNSGASDAGLTGLRNLGMTCYMSAIIQCMSNTKEMYSYFVYNQSHESEINRYSKFGTRGELTEELAEVLKALWSGQYKSIAPRDLKNAVSCYMPSFMGCEQQDSHEFLTMLLEKLHYDLNQAKDVPPVQLAPDLHVHIAIQKFWNNHLQRNNSMISKTFEGMLLSTLTCRTCLYESYAHETFTSLSLPIPSEHKCSLQDCLREEFTKTEKLETTWDCDRCKVKRTADRRIQLCQLPPILVIHLKRFSFDGIWRKKLNTCVDFPLESLDMSDYLFRVNQNTNTLYDLTGVVNHTGTLEGGHYTATCRNPRIGKWFKFDDTDVSDLTAADVRTQKTFAAGYVFFYSVRDRRV